MLVVLQIHTFLKRLVDSNDSTSSQNEHYSYLISLIRSMSIQDYAPNTRC
jgi:hypothetical protein